ncbi:MAG: EAL domain-containing protein [Proteobacteria bacterium]|jgi:diguanylate cyclase (GGDEF)-like protein/PAS domain S-box-containing protein|nr:EAL domain-containing protein [Pseudomonadota bacterium]
MDQELRRIHYRLVFVILGSFALTPIIGTTVAIKFGMVRLSQLLDWPVAAVLLLVYAGLVVGLVHHFRHLLLPTIKQANRPDAGKLQEVFERRLYGFTDNYWSYYLVYALLVPTVQHWFGISAPGYAGWTSLLLSILLQLVIAILVGMPGYLQSLSLLGRAAQYTGLDHVHISMKSRILLIGGFIPLLTTTILLEYYWWRTGFLSTEILLVWCLMGLVAFVITAIAIRSLSHSLAPVTEVISGSGASNYTDLSRRLRPRSIDEIGYLIQTLGRLFSRLGEQESHMRAIVDNAAEGIIVANENSEIETFNTAAENLFGYRAQEIRGRPLSWLLPSLSVSRLKLPTYAEEMELEGLHRSRDSLPLSLRASRMQMDGKTFYTLMVADISERKATEQMLLEAEARYRDLVETAHDLVWSMDPDGRWTYLNDAVSRIYGYAPNEMLHHHFSEYQAPESIERDAAAHAAMLRGEEILHYETVHLDRHGNRRYISFNARPQANRDGQIVQITGTARDITEQKAYEEELAYQAQHDSLTALFNRNYFQQELEREIARIARSGSECALLYLDLDQFKYVNDTLGHAAGDRLLVECAQMLRKHLREGDLLARFGGDEFTVLLFDVDLEAARHVAEYIRVLFENYRFIDSGKTFNVTASIGVSEINSTIENAELALSQADLACNIAKSQGRNTLHLFNPADRQKDGMAEDMGWASRVRDAFENDKFKLAFQPIVSVADGVVHDYEVLLRMTMDDGDIILPGGFMPAAERFGLMNNVDRWTVNRAMHKLADLHETNPGIRFAINLSGLAFEDQELLGLIHGVLQDTGLNPSHLTFEITESAAISNLAAATKFIYKLKDMGCEFALDDFGTGFSSFAYLKHLPVDKLKIDGSFVKGMAEERVDQAMVQSMNEIAHALGKKTIAEFVESEAILKLLRGYGVDYAQGHHLGKPRASIDLPKPNVDNVIPLI